ncbi:uncharacterized protein MYCFIDRAFT_173961 [Pseudocercospora fijiensis CIRAD86]|uniref:Uncharacterized protein n=1 Tax=Pseudocercospora fijiensis (strain CIRAD86) TaxID=383855 RepID=M3AKJ0_PSEFD|nr:uncharacterized protein MYCFIDRAFT_173961 [Pseudocercospora fijiensis CIRAD86]EME85101.1 hypothetical protein MYCFIDRAFT_173961 [Pseudocercospora fijiensis CIRAD86]
MNDISKYTFQSYFSYNIYNIPGAKISGADTWHRPREFHQQRPKIVSLCQRQHLNALYRTPKTLRSHDGLTFRKECHRVVWKEAYAASFAKALLVFPEFLVPDSFNSHLRSRLGGPLTNGTAIDSNTPSTHTHHPPRLDFLQYLYFIFSLFLLVAMIRIHVNRNAKYGTQGCKTESTRTKTPTNSNIKPKGKVEVSPREYVQSLSAGTDGVLAVQD